MQPIRQEFQVRFRYAVHFTTGLFAPGNPLFAEVVREHASGETGPVPGAPPGTRPDERGVHPARLMVVIDAGVAQHHPALVPEIEAYCRAHPAVVQLVRPPLLVPGGERVKNEQEWVLTVQHAIDQVGLCRHSFVAAVGGGAVLDMVGLAAATAHRGVRLIRIPTTVLSQNDSGVGVKNGINAFGKKNFFGTFAPPFAVVNDFRFLTALSDRDWRSGIAEAVKVALIRDAAFFEFLEERAQALAARDMPAMQQLIHRCAELHLRQIATSGDPFEYGSARPLDFGHWAAHKLEQLTNYHLRHGEAVAIGIALDSAYSQLAGFLPAHDWERIARLLEAVGFVLWVPELVRHLEEPRHPHSLLRGLEEFREHLGGELTVTLLRGIGRGFETHAIDQRTVIRATALLERISQVGIGDARRSTLGAIPGRGPAVIHAG